MPAVLRQPPIFERWKRWDSGSRQRVTRYWRDIAERDPTFSTVVMTIECVFGSDTIVRIARIPITTTSNLDGRVFHYQPGLMAEPSVDSSVQLGNQSAAARTVTFTIPTHLINAGAVLARGRILAGLGEVSLQVEGGDYDMRLVLLRGDMSGGVQFGAVGEVVDIQIADPRETQSLYVPDKSIDLTTWPLAQDTAVGVRYPLVFNGYPKVPCPRVLDDFVTTGLQFLVASPGHELDFSAVYVNGVDVPAGGASQYQPWGKLDTEDSDNAQVLLASFSATAGPWESRDVVHVDTVLADPATAKSTIQVMRDLLQGYTSLGSLGLNPDLFSDAEGRMPSTPPQVLINASGEDAARVQDFVESGLIKCFPMVHLVYQNRGLGPVVIDRRVGAGGIGIAGKVEGPDVFPLIKRQTLYDEMPKADVFNEYEVRYALNLMDDTWGGVVKRNASNSEVCRLSQEMVGGVRPYPVLECPFVFEAVQANYIIDWLAAHRSVPSYYVEWTCWPWVLVRYSLGQNVRYTDTEVPVFTDAVATIEKIEYERGKPTIGFRVWHPFWSQELTGPPAG